MLTVYTQKEISDWLLRVMAPLAVMISLIAIPFIWLSAPGQLHRIIPPSLFLFMITPVWLGARYGWIKHNSPWILLCLLFPILVGMIFNGGIRAPIFVGILPITMIVFCLYGKTGTIAFCAITPLVGALFVILEKKQVLPYAEPASAALILVVYTAWLVLALISIIAPVRLMSRALKLSETRRRVAEKAIAQRNLTLKNLQDSEDRYRLLAENVNDVIWKSDLAFHWLYLSPSIEKLIGVPHEKAVNKPLLELVTPESARKLETIFQDTLDTPKPPTDKDIRKTLEVEYYRADGTTVWAEMNISLDFDKDGVPEGIYGVTRNIENRKQAEKEKAALETRLARSEKMEAIGTLAGGISHDFNNILGAIIGYGEIIELFDAPDDSALKENLTELLQAAYRAKHLVKQILIMSNQEDRHLEPIRLDPILKEAIQFLRASLPATIEIKQNIVDLPGTVLADATQLHQVVMNLCTNAVQAMGEKSGTLEISLNTGYVDERTADRAADLRPGAYAKLSVADTGDGISEEIQERLFEPYFTTKGTGKGTGLGLAVTHGIIQQHGGAIIVDSRPGQGSTFHVMLPLTVNAPADKQDRSEPPVKTGKGRILLVDDEEMLVNFGKKPLDHLGYYVDTETDSTRALERFWESPDRYDMIISDQTMPGITGLELARNVKAIRPDIPIILCTGFSDMVTSKRLAEAGIDVMVPKPVGVRQLSDAVARILS